jgi:hypothetical protein
MVTTPTTYASIRTNGSSATLDEKAASTATVVTKWPGRGSSQWYSSTRASRPPPTGERTRL